jgi:hypothetical protein
VSEETRTLITFATASTSLLWRLLSEQKLWTAERLTYIGCMYSVAYVTGLELVRKLFGS